ncbi:helix-turn-helix domain-containing protein, partial [Halobium palmae]
FVACDLPTLRSIVADLRSCCGDVRLQRLTRSAPDDRRTLLFVDRTAFTDRQYEVLRTAHEMGYFAQPKEADSADVAAALDISVPTFSEHLSVAQEKLLEQLLAV